MPKRRKGKDPREDALRAAEARVKECMVRLNLAKLGGKQHEIESKREKLSIAVAQREQLQRKARRKAR